MGNVVLADSIAHLPEFGAWYRTIKETVEEIELEKMLVYIIDSVDASALPSLAEQFDVLGYKGFRLAQTELDQRELLKRSIELHRYKGTEWAIKEALKSIGFPEVKIIKTGYDHWAKFGIELVNSANILTAESFNDILQMVAEYKRAVCVLMEIKIALVYEDTLDIGEDIGQVLPAFHTDDDLSLSGTLLYDGTGQHDAEYDYSGDSDIVTFTQI